MFQCRSAFFRGEDDDDDDAAATTALRCVYRVKKVKAWWRLLQHLAESGLTTWRWRP